MAAKEVPNLGALEQYSKPLNWCPLPSKLKIKLARAGYVTVGDVADFKAAKLSQSIDVTEEEAVLILDVSQSKATLSKTEAERDVTPKCLSLKELLEKEKELGSIVTFCAKFDDMLGGGIPLGKITEICGSAGTGKTQLCMQLAVDVTFPGEFGGVAGHTLYIDTEGSMVVERLAQMARAAVKHITDVAENVYGDVAGMKEKASEYTFEHVMESIHCYRCTHYLDLLAVINLLPEVCTANPLVRLVVVDSIACPFRSTFSDMVLRNRLLNGVAQSLIKLAVERSLAVSNPCLPDCVLGTRENLTYI
jgi:RAD51-like protein 2